jgi:hypothetical protein
MNKLLLALIFLTGLKVSAQEFRYESRFYLLQNYIRQNAIKTITLGRSEDSLSAWKVEGLKLAFDSLGRLLMIEAPFNSTKTQRVFYTYEGGHRIYATKEYYVQDDSTGYEPIQKWEITTNAEYSETSEILRLNRSNADDTLRKNFIRYDDQGRMSLRSTCPHRGNIITSGFRYNMQGAISQFETGYCAQQNPDSCFGGEISEFIYDDSLRISKILNVRKTVDKTGRLNQRISFHYPGPGLVFVTDSSAYQARKYENYEFVTRYHGRVDFYAITLNKTGLVAVIRETSSYSKSTAFLTFSYTFFDDPRVRESGADASEFLLYYFAPLDWMRMY